MRSKEDHLIENKSRVLKSKLREEMRKRWAEHFAEVLNREEPIEPVRDEESQTEEIEEIDCTKPRLAEIKTAIKGLKNGKASGIDDITSEMLKADINFTAKRVKELLDKVWEQEKTPEKWRRGLIIKLPKKGNLRECRNWRGITLLPVVSKILGRIIVDRIRRGIDHKLREEQAGFRKGRGTTEQVFVLRNIIEQVNEWQATLYLNFIDFEKAFDSVHRDSLWRIMKSYGVPEKIINVVKMFYKDFMCAVVDKCELGDWFEIKAGVKQGCNMSGFLFLLVIDWVMRRTTGNGERGIRWNFTTKLDDLDFADDIALIASTRQHIQEKTTMMSGNAGRVGLKINAEKTKVMRINARQSDPIVVENNVIEDVEKFMYLGATVSKEGGGTEDLKSRVSKARGTFARLYSIWRSSRISRKTKLRLYKTLVLPVLLYGCETWKVNKGDSHTMDTFHHKCLRQILAIKWQDKVQNEEVLTRAGMREVSQEVQLRRWRFIGHTLRQSRNNNTNVALTWRPEGKRKVGRPKTTWRRTVEQERTKAGWKTWNQARVVAADRTKWRNSVAALCATGHEADR